MTGDDDLNLSGKWKGIFNYPYRYPPTQFDAEIKEHQGSFDGETFERAVRFAMWARS